MKKYSQVRFDRIVFCGSIVDPGYPWADLAVLGQVRSVLTQYGGEDFWAWVVQWGVEDAGPSGYSGFVRPGAVMHQQNHPKFEHSDYFYDLNYNQNWIPFLLGNLPSAVITSPVSRKAPVNWKFRLVLAIGLLMCLAAILSSGWSFRSWSQKQTAAAGLQIQHQYIEKKGKVALEGEVPSANLQKPELRLSMSGGNVFTPDALDVRDRLTGIALNVKVWNTGAASVATDWSLAVIAQGKTTAIAQLTKIPEHLSLAGPINSAVIRASDAIDVRTSTHPISTQPLDGTLLFYVPLKRAVVLQPSTRLELTVTDIYGVKTLTSQIMGDWLRR